MDTTSMVLSTYQTQLEKAEELSRKTRRQRRIWLITYLPLFIWIGMVGVSPFLAVLAGMLAGVDNDLIQDDLHKLEKLNKSLALNEGAYAHQMLVAADPEFAATLHSCEGDSE